MYCIVDIETTGGNHKSGKITEIAGFLHDGNKIVERFSTLVKPGIPIPSFITKLTGISNEMVADAPTFEEVADDLERFTANAIFVAHNVNFDYGFIREEYRNIGRDFTRKKLCTVHLSRKTFPDLESYSLGKISKQLGIELLDHHRAESDARATVSLFEKIIAGNAEKGLFETQFGIQNIARINSPLIDLEMLKEIPDDCGVYKFYSKQDELIYVKRTPELISSISAKLTPNGSETSNAIIDETYRIDWDVTGSGLLAQLLEVNEVIKNKPKFNNGKFSIKVQFGLFINHSDDTTRIELKKCRKNDKPEMTFGNFYEGLDYLKDIASTHTIRLVTSGNEKTTPPHLDLDDVAFTDEIYALIFPSETCLIIDEGLTAIERTIVLIEEGAVTGAGYFNKDMGYTHLSLDDMSIKFEHAPELEMVVRKFIEKGRFEQKIIIPANA